MATYRYVAPQKGEAPQTAPVPLKAPVPQKPPPIPNHAKSQPYHAPPQPAQATPQANQAQQASDRRTQRRIELEVEIGMESDHNFYTGLTQDISTGGIFVATGMTYDVGEKVKITFSLPGRPEPLEVEAQVRWVRDPRTVRTDGPEGMGLKFVNLTPEAQTAIAEFLDKRDSIFYDDE